MHACTCVCIHAWFMAYVCLHDMLTCFVLPVLWISAPGHIRTPLHTCIHVRTCKYVKWSYLHIATYSRLCYLPMCMHVHVHACTQYAYTYVSMYGLYACIYRCMYASMQTCTIGQREHILLNCSFVLCCLYVLSVPFRL